MTSRKGSARPGGGKASDTQKVSADSRAAAAKFPIVGLGASAGGLEAYDTTRGLGPFPDEPENSVFSPPDDHQMW